MSRKTRILSVCIIGLPLLVVLLFLGGALIGGLIPSVGSPEYRAKTGQNDNTDIYLISTLLHTDIAIPANQDVLKKFAFLAKDDFPLDHPNLRYLVIGWGSRSFYTSTKNLVDVGIGPTFKAITGDDSVMHISPAGELSGIRELKKITLSQHALENMTEQILKSFHRTSGGDFKVLSGVSHGIRDLFYEARGHFNILKPCNIWTARMIRSAGISTGIWTPTTYSLLMSVHLHHD